MSYQKHGLYGHWQTWQVLSLIKYIPGQEYWILFLTMKFSRISYLDLSHACVYIFLANFKVWVFIHFMREAYNRNINVQQADVSAHAERWRHGNM